MTIVIVVLIVAVVAAFAARGGGPRVTEIDHSVRRKKEKGE